MKILFFASDYKIGLSSLLVDEIIAFSSISNINIIGIAGEKSQEPDLINHINEHKIILKIIPGIDEHKKFFKLLKELRHFVTNQKPDIVHVQNNWQLVLIGLIKIYSVPPLDFKIIYTIHGFRHNHVIKSIISRIIIGFLLYLFSDRIIYTSDYVLRKFKLLNYKLSKIYIGADPRFFNKLTNHIDTDSLKLIYPAEFRYGKNQKLLIKAFSLYCKEKADRISVLYLPGDGPLKKDCQTLACSLQISEQVIFPGLLAKIKIRDLYEKCNIGIVSSNSETFGQAIIEPFVLGRCVITRKVGVAPDIILNGENGFFFDNEEDLKYLLIKISKDKMLIKKTGDNNFAERDIFSWPQSAIKYSVLINNLIKFS